MNLESLIAVAKEQGASDLHLESGLPPAFRIRGTLRTIGEPVAGKDLLEAARHVIGPNHWQEFLDRRSFDLSSTIHGVRCRINVLTSSRGVGFAVRLLSSAQVTIDHLNLHPDLRRLIHNPHGLILMSGPTGSGKTSTLAALIQEINLCDSRHIVTVESPIEYFFRPRKAFIRQREVGRDTPSFEQALLDSLREDPDVLMVGEMREPQVMRLTLNAAETGHLVLATVHSSTCAEALQRVVSAFPAEIQSAVRAQLADCLLAVVSQRLRYRPDLQIRVPECEILMATHAVKAFVRQGDFFKIASALEIGAESGMWSFQRYQTWMGKRTNWFIPRSEEPPDTEPDQADSSAILPPPSKLPVSGSPSDPPLPAPGSRPALRGKSDAAGLIEIEPHEGGLEDLLKKF
ncbi:MAG: PilT/PilU family type 4a pilus ATPase [Pedosphaera sp.]|nr:PilT/PilU family type 4a pilus ATPase [Pedosphaera sp.]